MIMDEVIKERKDEYEVHIAKYFWNSVFIYLLKVMKKLHIRYWFRLLDYNHIIEIESITESTSSFSNIKFLVSLNQSTKNS